MKQEQAAVDPPAQAGEGLPDGDARVPRGRGRPRKSAASSVHGGLTLRQLTVFAAVARHSSAVKAAAELGVSQPAVSVHIKQLENWTSFTLFHRSSRRLSLTASGEMFLAYAAPLLESMKQIEAAVQRMRNQRST
jgi:DNA-binding MarR family transcriptional regulator